MRKRRAAFAALIGAALAAGAITATTASAQEVPSAPVNTVRACPAPSTPHMMSCLAMVRTDVKAQAVTSAAAPAGYGPADLTSAYNLPTGGAGKTVAIIDAFDDPNAETDLATYRTRFGLPACTTANGCFKKVNQSGAASPLPVADAGWGLEISLDLDMVSAVCPQCHIMLVEANDNNGANLFAAVNTAVRLGAKYVSNSYGGNEFGSQPSFDDQVFRKTGVVFTASTGDGGTGALYPATSRFVTAVGGTTLNRATNTRGWTETAWGGAGSGCSSFSAKPDWQTVKTSCARRADADVSAVADPNTGVAVADTFGASGWLVVGGTSASAPIIASVYALAGTPGANDFPAAYPYSHTSKLYDVKSGSNGACGAPICTAGTGWDGPTGLGTPHGTAAFTTSLKWTGWSQIPGGGKSPDGPTSVTFGGKQRLIVRGEDNQIYINTLSGSTWSGWSAVPGNGATPSGPAAVVFNSKLYVFVRGTDNGVYQNVFDGSTWTGWSAVAGGGRTPSGPSAVVYNGALRVLVRGTDNGIYLNTLSGSTWTGWNELGGGGRTLSTPTAVVFNGTLRAFARGTDDGLYLNTFNGAWSGWSQISGASTTPSGPAAVVFNGTLRVFVRGEDNGIYLKVFDESAWTGWSQVPINGRTLSAPTVSLLGAHIRVYVRGLDDTLWVNQL